MASKSERYQLATLSLCCGLGSMLRDRLHSGEHLETGRQAQLIAEMAGNALRGELWGQIDITEKQALDIHHGIRTYLRDGFHSDAEDIPARAMTSAALRHVETILEALEDSNAGNKPSEILRKQKRIEVLDALSVELIRLDVLLTNSDKYGDDDGLDIAMQADRIWNEVIG